MNKKGGASAPPFFFFFYDEWFSLTTGQIVIGASKGYYCTGDAAAGIVVIRNHRE